MWLNCIINFPSYLFHMFGKMLNCYFKIILFNLNTRTHHFLYQLINPSFYPLSNCLHWINQFIPGFLFEQFANYRPEFLFIFWSILIFILTTFLNNNQLFMRFYILVPSFFFGFLSSEFDLTSDSGAGVCQSSEDEGWLLVEEALTPWCVGIPLWLFFLLVLPQVVPLHLLLLFVLLWSLLDIEIWAFW